MKEQESKAKKVVAIVLFFALVSTMIAGAWYYSSVVLNDSDGANTNNSGQSSKTKNLTKEEEIEASITDSIGDIEARINSDQSDPEIMNYSTAVTNAVAGAVDESVLDEGSCAAVQAFGTASAKAIANEKKAMEKTFESLKGLLLAKWNVQDSTTKSERKTAESLFSGLLTLYEKTTAKSAEQVATVDTYRDDQLLVLGTFHDDYNVVQATYRDDHLTLAGAQHKALGGMLDEFTANIQKAVTKTQQNCNDPGATLLLTGDIIRMKTEFIKDTSKENTESFSKATQLLKTRNEEVSRIAETFLHESHDLRLTLENNFY